MTFAPPLKVAVIGAGVAGLATARALKSDGHQVTVFEKSERLGGNWVYDPRTESDPLSQDPYRETVHSSLYPSLRTNLPRQLMGFSDYPFCIRSNGADSDQTFPGHKDVLRFISEFAEEFGLVELIRFGMKVIRVERIGLKNPDEWVVEWRNGDDEIFEEVFDAVVACSGYHSKPRLAPIPGIEKWRGKQLHSHNYRGPRPFHDKIVLVIGVGPSGFDISVEISQVAKEVHIAYKTNSGLTIFKLESRGNIVLHSEVSCVHENGVVDFEDGPSVLADIIIHCTGFECDIPYLKTDEIVTVDNNCIGPLYKHVFPPKLAPRLSFIGLAFQGLVIQTIDLQTKWLSHVLSGKGALPSEEKMMADVEQHYKNMEAKGIPKRHTHRIGFQGCFEYMNSLAKEAGLPEVDEQIKSITGSYLKFIAESSIWRAREWEPSNLIGEDVTQ